MKCSTCNPMYQLLTNFHIKSMDAIYTRGIASDESQTARTFQKYIIFINRLECELCNTCPCQLGKHLAKMRVLNRIISGLWGQAFFTGLENRILWLNLYQIWGQTLNVCFTQVQMFWSFG